MRATFFANSKVRALVKRGVSTPSHLQNGRTRSFRRQLVNKSGFLKLLKKRILVNKSGFSPKNL